MWNRRVEVIIICDHIIIYNVKMFRHSLEIEQIPSVRNLDVHIIFTM